MSVIENKVSNAGKLRAALQNTASRAAESVGLPAFRYKPASHTVTNPCGKHAAPGRRIIGYTRTGPFHRQVGIRWLAGECWPIMQTFFKHTFRHATKGPRTYTGGPSIVIPRPTRAMNHAAAFYGSHYGIPR